MKDDFLRKSIRFHINLIINSKLLFHFGRFESDKKKKDTLTKRLSKSRVKMVM